MLGRSITNWILIQLVVLAMPIVLAGQSQQTYLFGTVTNPIKKDLSFHFFKDNISYEEIQFDIELNDANRFGTQFELSEALAAKLIYHNTEIPLLLFPGDSLNITFDALNPAQNISFSGPGAQQNRWFFESALEFREYSEEVVNEAIIEKSPVAFNLYLDRVHQQKLRYLKQWSVGKNMSPAKLGFIQNDIEYWRVYQLLRYPFVKTASVGNQAMVHLPANYFQALGKVLWNNPEMLSSPNYLNFLDQLNQYWNEVPKLNATLRGFCNEMTVRAPRMLVLASADSPPVIADLTKGETVLNLNQPSSIRSTIQIGEEFIEGNWLKIKTGAGLIGYVNDAGMEPSEAPAEKSLIEMLASKAGAYQATKNYYWSQEGAKSEIVKLLSSDENYKEYLSLVEPKETIELTGIESFHLRNPRVLESDDVNLLFGEAPVITPPAMIGSLAGRNSRMANKVSLPDLGRELDPEPRLNDAMLTGTISGLGKTEPSVSYLIDLVQVKDEKRIIKVNSGGSFSIKVPLAATQMVTFSVGNQSLKLLLSPGETSKLTTQASDTKGRTKFSGANANANAFILSMAKYENLKAPEYNRLIKEVDGDGFTQLVAAYKDDWNQSLTKVYGLTSETKDLLQAEITYWYGNQLLNFPWEQPLRLGRDAPLKMSDAYYYFIEDLPISQDSYIWNPSFLNYLDQVMTYLKNERGMTVQEIADNRLSGKTYWWAKGQELARNIRRGAIADHLESLISFLDQCPYPSFSNRLKELYNENRGLGAGDPAPDFSLTDVFGKEVNLSSFAGSVVYLDFWATWCTPCLTQMRNSRQWKDKFQGEKVVFLYVSLDQDASKWRRYLSTHQIQGSHVHAGSGNVFGTSIAKAYGVKKLPAVFIIGKDGTIEYSSPQEGGGVVTAEIIQSLL